MSNLTLDQLKQMVKNPHIDHWHEVLDQLLPDYDINTPLRVAHFIAQCAHESGNFVFIKENLNYRADSLMKTFKRYFPTLDLAQQYEKKPEKSPIVCMPIAWATVMKLLGMVGATVVVV